MAFLIRSVRPADLSDLQALGKELNTVNLPSQGVDLQKMIRRSVQSFAGKYPKKSGKAQFLFVVEDTSKGKVVGTSKIFARHGTPDRPHVYFQVMEEKVASKTLSVRFKRKFYRFRADTKGYTEIGGLVLDPGYRTRSEKLGKQLSWIRFVFLRVHPSWFMKRVIAELLPPLHTESPSTLYDFYGFHLTRIPYQKADLLSFKNKEFILKLFPKSDLYFDILPPAVQADIEKTGRGSELARKMLAKIGFRYARQIDPFDGGPYYTANRDQISVYRKTKSFKLGGSLKIISKKNFLVMTDFGREVRAMLSPVKIKKNKLYLPPSVCGELGVREGQAIFIHPWS